ncbi:MAG: flagellar protein FlaG [Anaerolineae bacterium]|nr:flagellar protein FlaG [Anaerolineae bacterium]
MTDNPVSNVNRVELQPAQAVQAQVSQMTAQAAKETIPVKAVEETGKEATTSDSTEKQSSSLPITGRQTNLKFDVDMNTHQVTIMIMDRATNKVISTIPPDKIKDVPPGDLLQYQI